MHSKIPGGIHIFAAANKNTSLSMPLLMLHIQHACIRIFVFIFFFLLLLAILQFKVENVYEKNICKNKVGEKEMIDLTTIMNVFLQCRKFVFTG